MKFNIILSVILVGVARVKSEPMLGNLLPGTGLLGGTSDLLSVLPNLIKNTLGENGPLLGPALLKSTLLNNLIGTNAPLQVVTDVINSIACLAKAANSEPVMNILDAVLPLGTIKGLDLICRSPGGANLIQYLLGKDGLVGNMTQFAGCLVNNLRKGVLPLLSTSTMEAIYEATGGNCTGLIGGLNLKSLLSLSTGLLKNVLSLQNTTTLLNLLGEKGFLGGVGVNTLNAVTDLLSSIMCVLKSLPFENIVNLLNVNLPINVNLLSSLNKMCTSGGKDLLNAVLGNKGIVNELVCLANGIVNKIHVGQLIEILNVTGTENAKSFLGESCTKGSLDNLLGSLTSSTTILLKSLLGKFPLDEVFKLKLDGLLKLSAIIKGTDIEKIVNGLICIAMDVGLEKIPSYIENLGLRSLLGLSNQACTDGHLLFDNAPSLLETNFFAGIDEQILNNFKLKFGITDLSTLINNLSCLLEIITFKDIIWWSDRLGGVEPLKCFDVVQDSTAGVMARFFIHLGVNATVNLAKIMDLNLLLKIGAAVFSDPNADFETIIGQILCIKKSTSAVYFEALINTLLTGDIAVYYNIFCPNDKPLNIPPEVKSIFSNVIEKCHSSVNNPCQTAIQTVMNGNCSGACPFCSTLDGITASGTVDECNSHCLYCTSG